MEETHIQRHPLADRGLFSTVSSVAAKRFERPYARFHERSEVADYAADDAGVADDDAEFEVDHKRLISEIGAAEQRDAFIGSNQLGVQGGPRCSNHGAPVFGPSPECGVLPDRLEGCGCSYRPVQRATLVGCALEDQVDPHAAPRGPLEFVHHVGDAKCGEADHKQRLPRIVDQLADHGAGQPDGGGVAGGSADDHVAAAGRRVGVDEGGGFEGERDRGTRLR